MIDRFYENSTIGDGELTKLDILKSVWKCLLDTENMYDFLYRNTNEEQRKDLVYGECCAVFSGLATTAN
jgi:hypothetical protein